MSGFPVTNGVTTIIPPPKGYEVDFGNPQRQNLADVYWVAGVGNVLALLFLGQRLYTKCFLTKGVQLEDGKYFRFSLSHDMSSHLNCRVPCGRMGTLKYTIFFPRHRG
jgi:hypothetical protein